jgi:WD40 repeat protein
LRADRALQIPGYELLEVVGRGGLGVVYKARQLRLDRLVAIKVIRPEWLAHREAVRRFQREARAVARLAHPNIVGIHDAGQAGDWHYLVMEYIDGIDLGKLVARRGSLLVAQACDFIRQAACGLAHADEKGLIHRDIKPANLMVSGGAVKILDMGLARLCSPTSTGESGLSQEGTIIGTPDYIAPEQIDDPRRADIRADLYSLGCSFHFLLTGQVPFPGGSLVQKLDRQRWAPPAALRKLRPDVPEAVAVIVARLMAKRAEERYRTPVELTAVLQALQLPDVAAPVSPSATPSSADTPPSQRSLTKLKVAAPDTTARRSGRPLTGHRAAVHCLTVAPDGRRAVSGGEDRSVRVWDIDTGREIVCWELPLEQVLDVRFAGDRLLAAGDRAGDLILYDLESDRELAHWRSRAGSVESAAIDADGRFVVSGGADQSVRLWAVDSGREKRRIGGTVTERHWGAVRSVAFSPDGRRALSGSVDHTVRLWDLETGRELRCLRDHLTAVCHVAFSADGRLGLSCGGRGVRVWDVEDGRLLHRLTGHTRGVRWATFSPDGSLAVSGGDDRELRLWDVASGQEVQRLDGHHDSALCLAFAPDGSRIISGGADRTVRVWPLG